MFHDMFVGIFLIKEDKDLEMYVNHIHRLGRNTQTRSTSREVQAVDRGTSKVCVLGFGSFENLDPRSPTICFTICLFISPDLDGYRAPRYVSRYV